MKIDPKEKNWELYKRCSDKKAIEIAQEINYLKMQGKPYEHKEKELSLELSILNLNTRVFVGRAGKQIINETYK